MTTPSFQVGTARRAVRGRLVEAILARAINKNLSTRRNDAIFQRDENHSGYW